MTFSDDFTIGSMDELIKLINTATARGTVATANMMAISFVLTVLWSFYWNNRYVFPHLLTPAITLILPLPIFDNNSATISFLLKIDILNTLSQELF